MQNGMPINLKGYEVLERIGAGGFGAVYRAKQTTINREVAIKFIIPSHANQPDFIRRFEIEAQLIARLEHPHITPLIDYWRDPDGAYLVMRYLRGGSVRNVLNNGGYDLEATSRLLDQIASALEFAHRHDVIHRDIKPGNILLDEDENAYLADFGIAKDLNVNEVHNNPDAVVGSLDYISPEQARSEPITPRTDIYSLGVMLYEMITGEHPFKDASSVERLYKHINDPLPEIENLSDEIRDTINNIIQKATAKDPQNRYDDVLALAIAFREGIGRGSTSQDLSAIEQLTLREHEILQLIADGLTNRQISEQLFITVGTVKWHVNQLYKKLGIRSRVQAIVRARELNLIITQDELDGQIRVHESGISVISLPEPENPYKGLHAFQTADARDFYGRDELVDKLMKKLGNTQDRFSRFLAVVGPSGSGKSSLVKAGVIPTLWKGGLTGSEKWFVVDMMPGTHPLDELEIALTRVAANQATNLGEHLQRDARGLVRAAELILPQDDTELVVVVDQFEEVFTLVEDEKLRQHFLELLRVATTDKRSRVRVIVTLRADYYDKPLHYPEFGEMLRAQMETVLPLSAKGLERAVSAPAERVGVTFEPGLVAEIVSEMTYQAGALPLLQYAMTELFDRREGRLLTRAAYQAMGGAVGALANRADEIFLSFNEEAQELTRQLFLRLVTLGEGAEDTRRRTERKELLSLTDETDMMEEILDAFAFHRLLSLDHDEATRRPTVEVAHEAILREWERLRKWLNDSRDDIRQERLVQQVAGDWRINNRDKSYLLSGSRLEQAEHWAKSTELILTPLEIEYIEASLMEHETQIQAEIERKAHEASLEKQSYNRLRALVGVFAIATLVGLILAAVAVQASNTATQASNIAIAERDNAEFAAAQSKSVALAASAKQVMSEESNRGLALALAIEAATLTDEEPLPEVMRTLIDMAYAPNLRLDTTDPQGIETTEEIQYPNIMQQVAISPDGSNVAVIVASAYMSNNDIPPDVLIFDVEIGDVIQRFKGHSDATFAVQYAPDGQTLVTGGVFGEIIQWDTNTGEEVLRYDVSPKAWVRFLAVSPNNEILAAVVCPVGHPLTGCEDTWGIELYNYHTGEFLRRIEVANNSNLFNVLLFTPDSQNILTSAVMDYNEPMSRFIFEYDVDTGEEMNRFGPYRYQMYSMEFNEDESEILVMDQEAYVLLLDRHTGEQIVELGSERAEAQTLKAVFSPNGKLVAGTTRSGFLAVYDVETREKIMTFELGLETRDFEFTPDGRRLVTVNQDGQFKVWDFVQGNQLLQYSPDNIDMLGNIDISPDGKKLIVGSTSVRSFLEVSLPREYTSSFLWDVESGQEIGQLDDHLYFGTSSTFSPDGQYVATTDVGNQVRVWDVETTEIVERYNVDGSTGDVAFSPDGRLLYGAGSDTVRIWDRETGRVLQTIVQKYGADVFMPSDDGRWLLTSERLDINLWDIETGEKVQTFVGHDNFVDMVDFSPDGQQILSYGWDGTFRIWDIETGEELLKHSIAQADYGNTSDLSSDSRYVISMNNNYDILLLDVVSGNVLAKYSGHTDTLYGLAFVPGTNTFFSSSLDGTLRQWELPPLTVDEVLTWIAENRIVPDLTQADCVRFRLREDCIDNQSNYIINLTPQAIDPAGVLQLPMVEPTALPVAKTAVIGEQWGEITLNNSADLWHFDAQAGDVIDLRVIADDPASNVDGFATIPDVASGKFVSFVTVYAPDGNLIIKNVIDASYIESFNEAQGTGNTIFEQVTLPQTGTYEIEVRSQAYVTYGAYTLEIEPYIPPPVITVGEHRGNLEIGRKDLWHYEGQAGETLTIRANPDRPADVREWPDDFDALLQHITDNNHFPTILMLKPVDGDIIAQHDSGDEPIDSLTNALLEGIILPVDGIYEIEISTFDNLYGGTYTLIIESDQQG